VKLLTAFVLFAIYNVLLAGVLGEAFTINTLYFVQEQHPVRTVIWLMTLYLLLAVAAVPAVQYLQMLLGARTVFGDQAASQPETGKTDPA
jgi:hypothetical protein